MLMMPEVRSLFQRAILQSPALRAFPSSAVASAVGDQYLRLLGIDPDADNALAQLRAGFDQTAEHVVASQAEYEVDAILIAPLHHQQSSPDRRPRRSAGAAAQSRCQPATQQPESTSEVHASTIP